MKNHHLVLLCFVLVTISYTRTASADLKVNIFTKHGVEAETVQFTPTKTIELRCNATESGNVTWQKGGKALGDLNELKNRFDINTESSGTYVLTLKDLAETDVGNYSCVVTLQSGARASDTVALATATSSRWGVKVAKTVNVVEGEKLMLKCEVRGMLTLEWYYRNTTRGDVNYTKYSTSDERVKITSYYDEDTKKNVTNGQLKIEEVDMGDRGEYTCIGESEDGQTWNSTSIVRIKDKYAALWPFLGICAEVFVLCAIIFIYEKKRNKTELEESDTDQSPDQKNTPDHGKESNLRHRQ